MSFALMVNLAPLATVAAVLPQITAAWGLSGSEAGWIGGIYFAGYAAAVPVLASLTDRIDGRWIFLGCTLVGAGACLAFAGWADGVWSALALRFVGGAALGGVHMPGLKLLAERTAGRGRARGSAVYVSSYALGSAGSLFIAGTVEAALGWRAAFAASGLVPLLAVAAVALLPPRSETAPVTPVAFELRPLFRNRPLMAYVVGFAGNIWEVSAVRAWFVAYLAWTLTLPGNQLSVPSPAVISGLASLIGFPASLVVAEAALRWGSRAIVATCLVSVAVLLALAGSAGGSSLLILPLLVMAQVASLADASALASGAVTAADPARRGTALALYAFTGYLAAFAGPVAAGIALDLFGGAAAPAGWSAAFATMAIGSAIAACAVRRADDRRNRA
ncbi:MAG: MFS transporter [Alphaproteobacteria bacterium]